MNKSTFITEYGTILSLFVLMLSTFILGYFVGWWLQKVKNRNLIERLKKEVNQTKVDGQARDLEIIFSEIKPKVMRAIQDTQQHRKPPMQEEDIAERTRYNYITYTKQKPVLNFENFGYAVASQRDRLTKINGIGPYIEEKLNEIGIYTIDQISNFTYNDIQILTELIDFFPGRIEKDDWIGQAKSLKKINH